MVSRLTIACREGGMKDKATESIWDSSSFTLLDDYIMKVSSGDFTPWIVLAGFALGHFHYFRPVQK
jgi:hypothetical protein